MSASAVTGFPTDDVVEVLTAWEPPPAVEAMRDEYVAFVRDRGDAALSRDGGPVHLTASCFVFSPALTHVLLCFHKKGQFWVQVGGHIDAGDSGLIAAALREAREESGLTDLTVVEGVLDLDQHELAAAFGRCEMHWDVGVPVLSHMVPPRVSEESEQVAWFPVDALPEQAADSMPRRLGILLQQLRGR